MAKKPSPKTKSKAKKPSRAKTAAAEQTGDHDRMLPSKALILDLSSEMDKTLERTATLSGSFGQQMKDAVEKGVNQVAFRLAKRFHRMAQRDPLKAAITWEDFQYVMECLSFEKMIAKQMFPASETRSGRRSHSKKNGHTQKQTDIERDTSLADAMSEAIAADTEEVSEAVH